MSEEELPRTDLNNPEAETGGGQSQVVAAGGAAVGDKPRRGRPPGVKAEPRAEGAESRPQDNKVVKLLDKNPLGMTLPEMAGGPRQIKRIKTMRPILAEAIRAGLVMPVSQRAGHTVYRLVKHIANR
jgi:hypothetical protein